MKPTDGYERHQGNPGNEKECGTCDHKLFCITHPKEIDTTMAGLTGNRVCTDLGTQTVTVSGLNFDGEVFHKEFSL